ncbi:molybdopterin-guanine dinucleotide biosynthesis protein B [Thermodesulfatator indicus DSM 15286]|uniref:Molybdopterin-guanine dinucleotide biosynthesis protein B n=1 Tax=Thermodesulfatator indicus (strain DSM 15286 / JCM 11887 / CIR29812) TaxID=667014 RepID=F8A858_THEID|nr:molybdopterin-guanine dinucleotide biosynthesis protein MobB [Thermodesulfatator indicus]AEH45057.1 molybdopterin-guanine dinucleotide biosynthesis protein B [Thermodesulfatator indicus DSM 15286]
MPFAISFIGRHNSGKTTLAAQVAALLKAKGLKVGALKSSKEAGPRLEEGRQDTNLFWREGVEKVAFWGQNEGFLRFHVPEKNDFSFWYFVKRFFPEEDIVICEGFKSLRSLPKIEVVREDLPEEPLYKEGIPGLIAVVGDKKSPYRALPNDPEEIAEFILSIKPRPENNILLVDGRPVGLTRFVARALTETVRGFLRSLRGIKDPKVIELRLKLPEDKG